MYGEIIMYFIIAVIVIYLTIKLLKNLDDDMDSCDVSCSCYLNRENLEKQKEKYYKDKKNKEELSK